MLSWSLFDILARNWAMVTILSTLALICVVAYLVFRKYVLISLNILRTTKPPLARGPLDFERLCGEAVQFCAFDGSRLAGMLIRAPSEIERRGLVIFAHEYCSDMNSCARYCRGLHESGYDVFTFDFRGHGQSECDASYTARQWVTDRELDDMRGAIAFAEEWLSQHGFSREIGLFGISRGACAAILAAADDPDIACVVCDGAYSTDATIEHLMKRWAYIFATVRTVYENHHPAFWRFLRWCMLRAAAREFRCTFPSVKKAIIRMTPRPMLFIHGEKDSYLPVEQSRLLYALAGQPKHLWIAAGAKHNQAVVVHPARYAALVGEFFDRYLGRTAAAAIEPEVGRELVSTGNA